MARIRGRPYQQEIHKLWKSYLIDRNIRIRECDKYEKSLALRKGVPQSSVLEPILFII